MSGNGPLDLLAETGVMRVVLNNMDQRFDPDSTTALAGWKKGIRMRLELDYEGETYRYAGTIGDLSVPLSDDLVDKAFVTIVDWMEYAAKHPIANPGILTDQRGDDVIRTVLTLMPIQPAATDLDVGVSVFPTTFDTVTSQTKAYSEFGKVAFSEGGPVYLRKDRTNGETLVFESAGARNGLRALDDLPLSAAESGALLKEDGGYLLKEDGGKLLLNQAGTLTINNDMLDLEADYGKRVINYFTVYANPRRLDASAQVLFQLDEPIVIGSGQTVTIKGNFADPAGGFPIAGQGMIPPVQSTDYTMVKVVDSSDISSSLVLVSVPYDSDGFTHQVKNNSNFMATITKYNTRGYGIYNYNPIEHAEKDDASIAALGYETETIDQRLQTTLVQGRLYTARIVEYSKTPHTDLEKITLLANQSGSLMMAVLNFGPGNLVRVIHTGRNIDGYFYIQGVTDFKVTPGGLIMCTWILRAAFSLLLGLSQIAVEFGGYTTEDAINFGYLPHTTNLTRRSFSAWVYPNSESSNQDIITLWGESAGFLIRLSVSGSTAGHPALQIRSKMFSNLDLWTADSALTTGQWNHVVVTYDVTSYPSNPILYINGALVAWSSSSLSGSIPMEDETGIETIIGNENTANVPYFERAFNGKMKDVRIYNRILSAGEVTTLYNSGTPDETLVTNGMVFQAFCVRTKELGLYEDVTLTEALKVLDNVFGAVGTPHGAPVGRTP